MRRLLQAALVGAVFTLCLNMGNLSLLSQGKLTTEVLINHGTDEQYYLSLVRDAATGYPNLGHVAFKNHRFDPMMGSYAPAVMGLAMKSLGWDLRTTAIVGDLLFPFLGTLLFTLAFTFLLRSRPLALAMGFGLACYLGNYWLRSSNPQIPYILVAGWLAAFAWQGKRSWAAYIVRAVCLGLLVYVQVLYASLLIILEGVDGVRRLLWERQDWKRMLTEWAVFAVMFVALLIPKILTSLSSSADPAVADMYRRLGVMPTHYPSAPGLQVLLFLLIGILLFGRWRNADERDRRSIGIAITLLVASLVGLNQQVLHGIDGTFNNYYPNVIILFEWVVAGVIIHALVRHRMALLLISLFITLYSGVMLQVNMQENRIGWQAELGRIKAPESDAVIAWLAQQPGELVVAAPLRISNIIPVYTDHYVVINTYAFNQRSTDREMAERYLLQRALFPSMPVEPTYQPVFGMYAGMLSAKQRTACQIWNKVTFSQRECSVDFRTNIINKDALRLLDNNQPDIEGLLRTYNIDIIVAETDQTPGGCREVVRVGRYRLLDCRSE